ncbi:high-affinity nitrate transporter 3.1 [Amborella trichopoda]|nr:high-affinity nitrate transporter 3.1 [Amborella trichopoda]|eukprot:XP_006828375.2 high-affinity nitrate transporter 3.1 [Amborella trichopoda]
MVNGLPWIKQLDGFFMYQSEITHKVLNVQFFMYQPVSPSWSSNPSFPHGTDLQYKKIKIKLCSAPLSQKDRAGRKTVDDLKKDKTCQFKIAAQPYNPNNSRTTVSWLIERDIPSATYFIRAYALDSQDNELAYGQATNKNKTTNLFEVQARGLVSKQEG